MTGISFLSTHAKDGQDDPATSSDEAEEGRPNGGPASLLLISVSKDGLLKLWDVGSQHCIETHVAHGKGECCSLGLMPDGSGAVTGGSEGDLKVWFIDQQGLRTLSGLVDYQTSQQLVQDKGELSRYGRIRTTGIHFHPSKGYMAVYGSEKAVEIWRIRSEAEIKRSLARKQRRRREKLEALGETNEVTSEPVPDPKDAGVADIFVQHVIVRTGGKANAVDWIKQKSKNQIQLVLSTSNNQIEVYSVAAHSKDVKKDDQPEYTRLHAVDLQGHRTDIRSIVLSHDEQMIATVSNGTLKVWNARNQHCIRTLECGYGLCSAFLPGDRIVVIGTKEGELQLVDIASSTLTDSIKAHEREIWTLHVHPDGKSMISGSADKIVKFWAFEIVQEEIPGTRRTTPKLRLVPQRNLKLGDDVLCARFSPDGKLLAVSMLDNTIKVFFVDSLKLYLNLYGHKLPVLNFDIAQDSKLLVSCSADKNVRLWGLDFGDCHKALFAHQDSVMAVGFIPNLDSGHLFLSASKDRMVKYWDGDKFEQIQKLSGHHGEIWAMAISRKGDFVATASHDKSIRIWRQTDEQIFLEEEREKELEELYEGTLAANLAKDDLEDEEGADGADAGPATKRTVENLKAGERLIEALELCHEDLQLMEAWRAAKLTTPSLAPPARNAVFLANNNVSAEQHFLTTMQRVPAAALQDALLVLPFSALPPLLTLLAALAGHESDLPLTCRVLFLVLKTHYKQIAATRAMRVLLDRLRERLRAGLQAHKDRMGVNLAAMRFLEGGMAEVEEGRYVDVGGEEQEEEEKRRNVRKRGFVSLG